jgi:hypothetical protein
LYVHISYIDNNVYKQPWLLSKRIFITKNLLTTGNWARYLWFSSLDLRPLDASRQNESIPRPVAKHARNNLLRYARQCKLYTKNIISNLYNFRRSLSRGVTTCSGNANTTWQPNSSRYVGPMFRVLHSQPVSARKPWNMTLWYHSWKLGDNIHST